MTGGTAPGVWYKRTGKWGYAKDAEEQLSNRLLNMVRDARIGNPTAKEVLKCIADQSNDSGRGVWSSIAYFVFSTERDRSTVKRALRFLQDEDYIEHVNWTTYGTHLWKINTDKLEAVMRPWKRGPDDMDEDDIEYWEGQSEPGAKRADGEVTVTLGEGQTAPQAQINPNEPQIEYDEDGSPLLEGQVRPVEPTYIDDVDGVPDELEMEWDNFLKGWKTCFPDKAQPRRTNTSLRSKFKTRMKNADWRNNWRQALWKAKDWDWAQEEGWFKAEWVLKNNDNIHKLLDGTFDFKLNEKKQTGHVTRPQFVDARPQEE